MMNSEFSPSVQHAFGRTLDDVKRNLFELYNDRYQILDFKTVMKPGFLGFFQKESVDVSYVVKKQKTEADSFSESKEGILSNLKLDVAAIKQNAQILDSLEDVKNQLSELKNFSAAPQKHESITKIEEILNENEFTKSYIENISSRLRNEFSLDELDDFKTVQEKVVDWIGESIKVKKKTIAKLPNVVVLVGPTGVGKTTTISKIAANLILDAKRNDKPIPKIRLVTIDRTRVGAEEQLRKFGELMSVPVDKAETADDIKTIFNDYKDNFDYFLVDTSGYSPYDYENIGKMRAVLNVPDNLHLHPDIYLTFAASTKARDLEKIIQNYESFHFDSVIITKCDETMLYGNVLSVLSEQNKSIAYITDGQKVPRNIRRASAVEFLKNLDGFEINGFHIDEKFSEDN